MHHFGGIRRKSAKYTCLNTYLICISIMYASHSDSGSESSSDSASSSSSHNELQDIVRRSTRLKGPYSKRPRLRSHPRQQKYKSGSPDCVDSHDSVDMGVDMNDTTYEDSWTHVPMINGDELRVGSALCGDGIQNDNNGVVACIALLNSLSPVGPSGDGLYFCGKTYTEYADNCVRFSARCVGFGNYGDKPVDSVLDVSFHARRSKKVGCRCELVCVWSPIDNGFVVIGSPIFSHTGHVRWEGGYRSTFWWNSAEFRSFVL